MRKLMIVTCAVLLLSSTAYGKTIEKGSVELGGITSAFYANQNLDLEGFPEVEVSATSFLFDGNYYFLPNFGAGALLSYMKAKIEISGEDLEASMTLIGPQVKYNFDLSNPVSLFAVGSAGYINSTVKVLGLIDEDADGWYWNLGGGLKFFPHDTVSFDASVRYQDASLEGDTVDNLDIKGYLVGAGISIYFKTGGSK